MGASASCDQSVIVSLVLSCTVSQILQIFVTPPLIHPNFGIFPGPALGMFELFGQTGPPILGGPPFWTLKKFPYKLIVFTLYNTVDSVVHCFYTRRLLKPLNMPKMRWRHGALPQDPAGGAHDAPPDPLVGWGGGGTPPPQEPHLLGAFGASILVTSALAACRFVSSV